MTDKITIPELNLELKLEDKVSHNISIYKSTDDIIRHAVANSPLKLQEIFRSAINDWADRYKQLNKHIITDNK